MATSKIYLKYLCTSPHCSKPSGRWTYSSTSRRSSPCVRCVFTCSIGNSRTSLPQCPDGLDSRAVDLASDAWTVTRDTGGYILLSRNGCWHRCLRLHCNGDLTQKIDQIPDWMKHSMAPCLREVSWAKSPHPGGCQLTSRVWAHSMGSCSCFLEEWGQRYSLGAELVHWLEIPFKMKKKKHLVFCLHLS